MVRTMRHWLIALFLFAFLAVTGLSPSGTAVTEPASEGVSVAALVDTDEPDRGVSEASDLPEVILTFATPPASGAVVRGPLPPAWHKHPQPTLDGLQRPPRTHRVA